MTYSKWIRVFVVISALLLLPVMAINFLVDPYGIYGVTLFKFDKIKQSEKMRLVKAIRVQEIKPKSVVIGTSRAQFGFDPNHEYFTKPSYNLGVPACSVYESKLYLQWAVHQKNLEQVLLVLDYRMFNDKMKAQNNFENFFTSNRYEYLPSYTTFMDSLKTIKGASLYHQCLPNGQFEHSHNWNFILQEGGHFVGMPVKEAKYYRNFSTDFSYYDTHRSAFKDFDEIIDLCYKKNIKLEIIFGPSHVRQWEALDKYAGYGNWLKWKKMVVSRVAKSAEENKKTSFRVWDFAIYNEITTEKIPKNKDTAMQYYWDSGHYKNELGLIVLNILTGKKTDHNLSVELNMENIDTHLNRLQQHRLEYLKHVQRGL